MKRLGVVQFSLAGNPLGDEQGLTSWTTELLRTGRSTECRIHPFG